MDCKKIISETTLSNDFDLSHLESQSAKDQMLKREHPAVLPQKHLNKVQVLISRKEFLHQMQKVAVCMEVGVAKGDFSRKIMDAMKPHKLFLIDGVRVDECSIGSGPEMQGTSDFFQFEAKHPRLRNYELTDRKVIVKPKLT